MSLLVFPVSMITALSIFAVVLPTIAIIL